MARGEFHVVLEGIKGPSGASLLGRFCHADPALLRHVLAYVRAERDASPDAIYAEVVHQPQNRVGNIIARPVLTEYEIVYLGQSGAPIDRQIPISDLRLSVVDGRFVLRSQRLGREVIRRDDLFPHLQPGHPPLFNFKSMRGYVPPDQLRARPIDPALWVPEAPDYYRYALSRPQIAGLLFSVTRGRDLIALDAALGKGGLLPDEEDHLDELAVLTGQR